MTAAGFARQFVSVIKRKTRAVRSSAFRRCIPEGKHSSERRLKAELQTLNELACKATAAQGVIASGRHVPLPPPGSRFALTTVSRIDMHSYMKTATAKLFQHGGSQALRLPKEFRLPGTIAKLSKTPRGILVQPIEDDRRRARQFAKLEGSCPEFPDIDSPPGDRPREPLV